MIKLQAFKYEMIPNGENQRDMRRFAGARRFVFNKGLVYQNERYAKGEKKLGYAALCYVLKEWKSQPATKWLNDVHSQVLQQSLKDLEAAYRNFFEKRADFPQFKKKGKSNDSFRYPQGFKVDEANSRVCLPKIGWVRYRKSRNIQGVPSNVTVSTTNGKWFVSIQTEIDLVQPVHTSNSIIAADVGIARYITLSDGTFIEPINSFKIYQEQLAEAQRKMSRKKKFGKNWIKAKKKVTAIQHRIGNVRRDFLHKTSTTLSQNHACVVVEDLQIGNMSRSASGTIEEPGKNVSQKSALNRSILDQGWGEFMRQLGYKLEWFRGGCLLKVPPHNTSRTCPCCGHVSGDNRKTQAEFICVACGYANNADFAGALNILARGIKMLEGQDTADASAGCASTARIACEVNGAVMPSAAGTRRSYSQKNAS